MGPLKYRSVETRRRKDFNDAGGVEASSKAALFGAYICCSIINNVVWLFRSLPKNWVLIGTMEVQLSRIFQTVNHWNALILLDEADVYLEQRSIKDFGRNKLVSVFLRKLEYCDDIMFLITNRVSDFDEAILSRIHLMLEYDELGVDVRTQI